jgi:hypothetical protein
MTETPVKIWAARHNALAKAQDRQIQALSNQVAALTTDLTTLRQIVSQVPVLCRRVTEWESAFSSDDAPAWPDTFTDAVLMTEPVEVAEETEVDHGRNDVSPAEVEAMAYRMQLERAQAAAVSDRQRGGTNWRGLRATPNRPREPSSAVS